MKIKSIRYGFANNSSSSHSIVFLGDYKANDEDLGDFGWNFFTAASEESKKNYLLATLLANRNLFSIIPKTPLTEKVGWSNPFSYNDVMKKYNFSSYEQYNNSEQKDKVEFQERIYKNMEWDLLLDHFSDIFSKEMIQKWKETESADSWGNPYIDHQSIIALPKNVDGSLSIEFTKQLFSVLINKNFAFLGGNDNSDESHSLHSMNTYSDDKAVLTTLQALRVMGKENDGPICVYDKKNNDFIIQDIYKGDKIRLSFSSDEKTTKSSIPELVDLKITDYCDFGCTFCYQSSTKKGNHASFENLKSTIKMLANSGTMEIAIGGGEPTSHPDFLEILKEVKKYNMTACFTTKNFKLHEMPDFKEILELSNSIAFSCNSIAEVQKMQEVQEQASLIRDYSKKRAEFYIQMIPEVINDKNLDGILEYILNNLYRIPITFLGYKDFGFGENYKPKNRFADSEWIKTIKKHSDESRMRFGIDSILVSRWKQELIDNHVDPLALVGEEGKFSCFFDAVNMTVHKSSFSKEPGIQLSGDEENILEQFKNF